MGRQTEQQFFRIFNRLMVLMWRLGMGPLINVWPEVFGRIMVMIHTGRKTGLRRFTPANYAIIEEDIFCAAGFGSGSDWYRNLLANPGVEVWLPQGWWAGEAAPADDHPGRLEIMRRILINGGLAGGLFAGMDGRRISDADLAARVQDYRLVRNRRRQACTGPGGPSDLAWVWPALAHAAGLIWLLKRIGKAKSRNRRK